MSIPFEPQQGLIIGPAKLWGSTGSVVLRLAVDTGATSTQCCQARATGGKWTSFPYSQWYIFRLPGQFFNLSPSGGAFVSRQRVLLFGVPGSGRNGAITPSAPITSGRAVHAAAQGSAAGNVPAANPCNSAVTWTMTRCPTDWTQVHSVPALNGTPVNCRSKRQAVSYGTNTANRPPIP